MLKRSILFSVLSISLLTAYGQTAGEYLIGIQADLVKTDNSRIFNKAQFGAEVNYFVIDHFTATTGFEVWTADDLSFLLGARWYPNEDGFLRIRGLIGENDLSIGGGWVKPVSGNFRFEAIADFYFKIDFSIRIGMVYVFRRSE